MNPIEGFLYLVMAIGLIAIVFSIMEDEKKLAKWKQEDNYFRPRIIGIDWMNIRNIKAGIITEVR